MADWKTDLRTLADKLRLEQKNKKGFQSKFDKTVGYKKKLGFSSTGIPLTSRAENNYKGTEPLIKAKNPITKAQHCNRLTKKEQQLEMKDGNI